jgi:hypothetical protein
MTAWSIEPEARREGFARLRREQVIAEAQLTAQARIDAADELLRLARALRPTGEPLVPQGRPARGPEGRLRP